MIQYYKLLFIICFLTISYAEILKPSNEKYEIIKITDEKNKTRTYFHLNDGEQLIFENLLDFVTDKNAKYGVKIISRAKISPNSNSSKTFGIVLEIQEEDNRVVKELKYKKGSSTAKKSTKSGISTKIHETILPPHKPAMGEKKEPEKNPDSRDRGPTWCPSRWSLSRGRGPPCCPPRSSLGRARAPLWRQLPPKMALAGRLRESG